MKKVTLNSLKKMKENGEKSTCLTAYDATFAYQIATAGVDMILVGDSLGMVIQGLNSTVPVTMEHMEYHTKNVAMGLKASTQQPLLMVDLPYMSYATAMQSYENATRLMQAGAQVVKLEGGAWLVETIQGLTDRGIPICGHLGLTPQSVDALGGFKVQGRELKAAKQIKTDAIALVDAGIRLLVLECVPTQLAAEITEAVDIPVIGIGAGADTDAPGLVLQDMLGITQGFTPSFVKNFMADAKDIPAAFAAYIEQVKAGDFPSPAQSFE